MTTDSDLPGLATIRRSLSAQIGQSWALVAAMMASHLLSYLYQLFMSRSLPAPEFGLLNGLMAFSLLLTIPVNTIQLTVARHAAETVARGGYHQVLNYLRGDVRRSTPIILVGLGVYLALSPVLASFFHTSLLPVWLVGAISAISLYLPFAEGVLQGVQQFQLLAGSVFIRYIGKLALGMLLVLMGLGVVGGLAALFLCKVAAASFAFAVVAANWGGVHPGTNGAPEGGGSYPRDILPTLITYAALVLLMNADVALARHYLSATDSAHYAIAALLGKIAYYLPSFLIIIIVPKVASARASGRSTRQYLTAATFATLGASASVVLVYGLFPQQAISLLFGSTYASAETANLVFFYSLAMLILSVLYLEVHYLLARRFTRPLYGILAGPAVALVGMVRWHGSGVQLVGALTLGLLVGLLAVNVLTFARPRLALTP